jgi:hypothetical protein
MNAVNVIRQFSEKEVENIMRQVHLISYPDIQPYRSANISFSDADSLLPSAFYVLQSRIDFVQELQRKLLEVGIDIFTFQGGLEISIDGGPVYMLVPPIIEMTPEGNAIILDGIHRCYEAREQNRPIHVIEINKVDPEWPAYAKANPNGWDDLHVCDVVPPEKKLYRNIPERNLTYRDLYRDLPGTTGIREVGTN